MQILYTHMFVGIYKYLLINKLDFIVSKFLDNLIINLYFILYS